MNKRTAFPLCWLMISMLALLPLGCRPVASSAGKKLAVTNTTLESAAHDLLGDDVPILRLAEPGMCPGHFDLRPSQMTELRSCRAVLRFDFQKSLDARLRDADTNRFGIMEVSLRGGLCLPENYLSACRQLAESFVAIGWLSRTEADAKLKQITERMAALGVRLKDQVAQAGLAGRPVLASGHQKDFSEWLGLKVVASFRAADTASVAEIDQAIDAGQLAAVKLVVANLPEGRRTADALAERLHAQVIVFGNFPALHNGRISFDDLLAANVNALVAAKAR